MNIKINSVKFAANKKLEDFVHTKVKKLVQYYDDIISAEVFLKIENKWKLAGSFFEFLHTDPCTEWKENSWESN